MILHSKFGRYLELVIGIQQRTGDYLQIFSLGLHSRCNFSPTVQQSMSFYEICMSLLYFLVLLSWLEPHASGVLQVFPGTMRFEHTTLFSKNLIIHSMLGILVEPDVLKIHHWSFNPMERDFAGTLSVDRIWNKAYLFSISVLLGEVPKQ